MLLSHFVLYFIRMNIFKTRWFARWAKKENITDQNLLDAVDEIISGLIDADLGGGLHKKRIALAGKGKRGGARTIIAYNKNDVIFFVYGFAKNDKANIHIKELEAFKLYASELLSYTLSEINIAVKAEKLIEVNHE